MSVTTVAPLVGAWIEIMITTCAPYALGVAPLVGAWIEIDSRRCSIRGFKSLLSWERGLKSNNLMNNQKSFCRSSRGSVD